MDLVLGQAPTRREMQPAQSTSGSLRRELNIDRFRDNPCEVFVLSEDCLNAASLKNTDHQKKTRGGRTRFPSAAR